MLLLDGVISWKAELAGRAALLIDMEAYFDAAMDAMSRAKHCVHLLNWAFEANTLFHPEPGGRGKDSDRFGNLLIALARNPNIDVRVLCWKSAMPVAATQHFFPFVDRRVFAGTEVKFVLDGKLPVGACHHQKMIVIDDAIAFCGGGDIGPDRWAIRSGLARSRPPSPTSRSAYPAPARPGGPIPRSARTRRCMSPRSAPPRPASTWRTSISPRR